MSGFDRNVRFLTPHRTGLTRGVKTANFDIFDRKRGWIFDILPFLTFLTKMSVFDTFWTPLVLTKKSGVFTVLEVSGFPIGFDRKVHFLTFFLEKH